MADAITFPYARAYSQRGRSGGHRIRMPYVDVLYEADGGRQHKTSALVDSGATWSSIPEAIAVGRFNIDVNTCPRREVQTLDTDRPTEWPYQEMTLTLLGKTIRCDVLFTPSPIHVIGHIPVFSHFLFAFQGSQMPGSYRLLYRP